MKVGGRGSTFGDGRTRFFDNSYTHEFKSGRSAAVLRSAVSRVSCDSLVHEIKPWVLSSLLGRSWSLEVARGRLRAQNGDPYHRFGSVDSEVDSEIVECPC